MTGGAVTSLGGGIYVLCDITKGWVPEVVPAGPKCLFSGVFTDCQETQKSLLIGISGDVGTTCALCFGLHGEGVMFSALIVKPWPSSFIITPPKVLNPKRTPSSDTPMTLTMSQYLQPGAKKKKKQQIKHSKPCLLSQKYQQIIVLTTRSKQFLGSRDKSPHIPEAKHD